MITAKDLKEIEKRYDVAIYSIKWCSPRKNFRQESTINTAKGIGFVRWAKDLCRYWSARV